MIRVRQIKVPVLNGNLKQKLAQKLNVNLNDIIDYKIIKRSLDARHHDNIFYIYEVDVQVKGKVKYGPDVFEAESLNYTFLKIGSRKFKSRPVIVGAGPAGLFAAYLLAENGYRPLIIERGKDLGGRIKDVETFLKTGVLNPESNIQFGLGGAGTFSDGKLNTMIKDNVRQKKVFEVFVACGAPEEIMYDYAPHIGTDLLRNVIANMKQKIIEMGGEFRFETKLTSLVIKNNKLVGICLNENESMDVECLVLALGHSARDTFKMVYESGLNMTNKPFAVGVRVVHDQKMIDEAQYGKYANILGPASYKLTYKTHNNRGVYSFCMCPGGYVINASSNPGFLAINGMSNHKRDSGYAVSALVVTIDSKDYGSSIFDGLNFQEKLEKTAYQSLQGKIPIQTLKDFCNKNVSSNLKAFYPFFKGDYGFYDLNQILPDFITDSLKEAFPHFGKQIEHFDDDDVILAGVESRTSSPVRILRDENLETNIKGIYPCGEGAGYAGGITSAAIDGIKVAEIIGKIYGG